MLFFKRIIAFFLSFTLCADPRLAYAFTAPVFGGNSLSENRLSAEAMGDRALFALASTAKVQKSSTFEELASGITPASPAQSNFWSMRTGEGFGRINRSFTPAEESFYEELTYALAEGETGKVGFDHAEAISHTLLSLRGNSLQKLRDSKVIDDTDGRVLHDLSLGLLPAPIQSQAVQRLAKKLTTHYENYEILLRDEQKHGFDEAMLSNLLSTHLLPWGAIRKLQRTYHLGRDLAMVREALQYDDVEKRILERQTANELPGGRAPIPQFHRIPKPITVSHRQSHAKKLRAELQKRMAVLPYLSKLKGDTISYEDLQKINDRTCLVTIPGNDPIPLHRGQTIHVRGQYDLEFVISAVNSDTRQVSLWAQSGGVDPVGQLKRSGRLLAGENHSMSEKEEQHLATLLDPLSKSLESPLPGISERYNALLGLASLEPLEEKRPPERKAYQPVGSLQYINKDIAENASQAMAVQMSFDPPRVLSIQGPAATAKTTVAEEIARQWVQRGKKVLFLSQMHAAVDEAASRMKDLPILRVGNKPENFDADKKMQEYWPGKKDEIQQDVLETVDQKREAMRAHTGVEAGYVVFASNAGIVTDSFSQAARARDPEILKHDIDFNDFDLIIMDEASRETVSGALLPLQYLKPDGKLVVLGDVHQMGPHGLGAEEQAFRRAYKKMNSMATDEQIDQLVDTYNTSIQEWLQDTTNMDVPHIMLSTNYRQHPLNARLTSEVSYQNEVHVKGFEDFTANTFRIVDLKDLAESKNGPIYFDDSEEIEEGHRSFFNEKAIEQDLKLVQDYRKRFGPDFALDQITIVTPYIAQVLRLQEALQAAFPGETKLPIVTTIDSYQGGQNKYVIVDVVRSNGKYDVGLLRDIRRITVAISRDQLEKTIVCDTRMFLSKEALQLRDPMQSARLMLRSIVAFYAREVIPFFPRRLLTKKETDGADKSSSPVLRPPDNLVEAIRDQRELLFTQWDTHLLPLLQTPADIQHASEAFATSRSIQSAQGWPLGAWWWDMVARWEIAGWDDKVMADKLLQDLGGRKAIDAMQEEQIRAWVGGAHRRWDRSYLHLVDLLKRWSQTVALDDTESLRHLQWLYRHVPSSPLRKDIRNQYSQHVTFEIDHWRGRLDDLIVLEKRVAAQCEQLNTMPDASENQPLEPIIRKEEKSLYDSLFVVAYGMAVRKVLAPSAGWAWEDLQRYYAAGSRSLKKAISDESLSWGHNRLKNAGSNIARIRAARSDINNGLAIIQKAGPANQIAQVSDALLQESIQTISQLATNQFEKGRIPDWQLLRDLYEKEDLVVRAAIEQEFEMWGRRTLDQAGLDEESVTEANAAVEAGVRFMNPETATVHFEGDFIHTLKTHAKGRLQAAARQTDLSRSQNNIPLKQWQQEALRNQLRIYDVAESHTVPLTTLQSVWRIAWSDSPVADKVRELVANAPLAKMDKISLPSFLKGVRKLKNPTWYSDLLTILHARIDFKNPERKGSFYKFVRSSIRQEIAKMPTGSNALLILSDPLDFYEIPNEVLVKCDRLDIVTFATEATHSILLEKIQGMTQRAQNLPPPEKSAWLAAIAKIERGEKVRLIEASYGMFFDQPTVSVYEEIIQSATSWAEAEQRFRQYYRDIKDQRRHVGQAMVENYLDSDYGYIFSGVVPNFFIDMHIAFERQFLRRLIEMGVEPDQDLPLTLEDSHLWSSSALLADMENFQSQIYKNHHKVIRRSASEESVVTLITHDGVRMRRLDQGEPVSIAWDQVELMLTHPLALWAKHGREGSHLFANPSSQSFYIATNDQSAIEGSLTHYHLQKKHSLTEKPPSLLSMLASLDAAAIPTKDIRVPILPTARDEEAAQEELRFSAAHLETIRAFESVMAQDVMYMSSLEMIAQNIIVPLIEDRDPEEPIFMTLPTVKHSVAIPDALLKRPGLVVIFAPDNQRLKQTLIERGGQAIANRFAEDKIVVMESEGMRLEPLLYMGIQKIIRKAKTIHDARAEIMTLLDTIELAEEGAGILAKYGVDLAMSIDMLPLGLALWALTFERIALKHFYGDDVNLPQQLKDSNWFYAQTSGANQSEPLRFLEIMNKVMHVWGPAHIIRHEKLTQPNGKILITTPVGKAHFPHLPITSNSLLAMQHKLQLDDPFAQWFVSTRFLWEVLQQAQHIMPKALTGIFVSPPDNPSVAHVTHGLLLHRGDFKRLRGAS